MLSFVRRGKIAGIVSSMLLSALWRVYSNVPNVSAVGFTGSSCWSKLPWNTSGSLSILSSTSVLSVGRMSSYKWASELPGSFGLSSAAQIMESFSRPARPAVGGSFNRCKVPSIKDELEKSGMPDRGNKLREICKVAQVLRHREPVNLARFPGIGIWQDLSSSSPIVINSELSSTFRCQMMSKKHWQ